MASPLFLCSVSERISIMCIRKMVCICCNVEYAKKNKMDEMK